MTELFNSINIFDETQDSKVNNYKVSSWKGHRGGFSLVVTPSSNFVAKNGWFVEDSKNYYYKNGVKQTEWITINEDSYYLNPYTGIMHIGWHEINENWHHFNESGVMSKNTTVDGWKIDEHGIATIIGGQQTGITFNDYESRLLDLGFTFNTGTTYTYYDKDNGYFMGHVRVIENAAGFSLENNSAAFESAIKTSFNLLLPTQGDTLFNIVLNPFVDQTLWMDGRKVEIKQWPQGVGVTIENY